MTMQHFIDAWQESMSEILTLGLDDETGATETSLPGWRIRDILAHLVHIEELLAYSDEGTRMPPGSKPTGKSVSSSVTQAGVDALAEVSVADLLRRLDRAVQERAAHLQALPD